MKVSKIEIKDYFRFKNFELDLTYPEGHDKAGQPLDKVCFIGQSGTGKTTLLRILKCFISWNSFVEKNTKLPVPINEDLISLYLNYYGIIEIVSNTTDDTDSESLFYVIDRYENNNKMDEKGGQKKWDEFIQNNKPFLINFPTKILSNPITRNNYIDDEKAQKIIIEKINSIKSFEEKQIVDFATQDISEIWDLMLVHIKEHQTRELEQRAKFSEEIMKPETNWENVESKKEEFAKWLNENPNPLMPLAEKCLNPILKLFGLKVKTELDFDSIMNIGTLQIQTLDGKDIPYNFWSTGTRQIVERLVPLYELKPKNAVILMDEPERSLFPDLEKIIVDTYVSLAPESQFFFATHSPLIASSFEPWEIFHLEFDENYYITTRKYYNESEGRKVSSYFKNPQLLTWSGILKEIFGVKTNGNPKRTEELVKLAMLDSEIKNLISENKKSEAKEKQKEYKKLAELLDWEL